MIPLTIDGVFHHALQAGVTVLRARFEGGGEAVQLRCNRCKKEWNAAVRKTPAGERSLGDTFYRCPSGCNKTDFVAPLEEV